MHLKPSLNLIIWLGVGLIVVLGLRVDYLHRQYQHLIHYPEFVQQHYGLRYKVVKGAPPFKLIMGDLVGLNPLSYQYVSQWQPSDGGSYVVFPGLYPPRRREEIIPSNWANLISSDKGVVLVDNFCFKDWEKLKEKEIYQQTNLTPGPHCLSEGETHLLDYLIKSLAIKEVILYYDLPSYQEKIDTFLRYLTELGITYSLKPVPYE